MINKNNLNKFIQKSDDKVKEIVKKIFNNTSFITKKEFFREFYKNIDYLLSIIVKNKILNIYIFLNKDKNKSNYWLFKYFLKYIKKFNKELKISKFGYYNLSKISMKLNENDIVLFIDDCIYTGNQLGANIANFIDLSKDIIISKNKIIIFILVPYISNNGEKYVRDLYKYNNSTFKFKFKLIVNKYKNKRKLKNTDDILNNEEIELMNTYYPKNKNVSESSTYYFNDKILVVFYYKIADIQSTIPLFYKGLIPNYHNQIIMNNYDSNLTDFDIIPLLSKCITKNKININDICPIPPYKKNKSN